MVEEKTRSRRASSLDGPIISRSRANAALAESLFGRRPRRIRLHGVAGGESGEDIDESPSSPLELLRRESTMEPGCAWT